MGYKSTDLFLRWFVKDYQQIEKPAVRKQYGLLEGWFSIVLNVILFFIKLFFGLTINSVSLLADAFHTLADVITSAIVIISFWIAGKPKDKEHPYGHGRAEQIATLIIAVLLAMVGVEFLQQSFRRLLSPGVVEYSLAVMIVLLVSALLKEWMYRFAKDLGQRINSPALLGDAWHHRTDAFASLGIGVGLIGVFFGYTKVDAILGILVSGLIIYTAYEIGRDCANRLLGENPCPDLVREITQSVLQVDGVLGIHRIAIHEYGEEKYITAHIEVDPGLNLIEAHEISHLVEDTIGEKFKAHMSVHVDPQEEGEDQTR